MNTAQLKPIRDLSAIQWKTIEFCDTPRSLAEVMDRTGISHRGFFMRKHLQPLLEARLMKMTNPDNPTAANQKYVLTETGVELAVWKHAQSEQPKKD